MIASTTKSTTSVPPPTIVHRAQVGSFVRGGALVGGGVMPPTAGIGAPVGGGGVHGPGGGGGGVAAPGGAGGAVTAGKPLGGVSPWTGAGAETRVSPAVGPACAASVSAGAAAPVATV